MAIIEVKDVSFGYATGEGEQVKALDGVSFSIEEGEFVALVGHNGGGKSTVAKLLNGLIRPSSGSVTVFGVSTAEKDKLFDIRKNVGVVFQNPDNQMVATVIEDDVAFGPENIGLPREEIKARVAWALQAVGMEEYRKSAPFRLSGGQKQRVAIAGILAVKPRVLVLDEATAMLDPAGRREVLDVVKRLNKQEKMTVVMITHYMEEAVDADKILVLSQGKIICDGGRETFLMESLLRSAGLEPPMALSVADALRADGLDFGHPLTVDELAEKIAETL